MVMKGVVEITKGSGWYRRREGEQFSAILTFDQDVGHKVWFVDTVHFIRPENCRLISSLEEEDGQQQEQDKGRKADKTKLRTDLIPPEAITGMARAYTYGAVKYDARNWEKGMDWGQWFGAATRHLFQFWGGEDHDEESQLHHLESALCSVATLLAHYRRGLGKDDRGPESGDTFNLNFNPKEVPQK